LTVGYSSRPLAAKLGLKDGQRVAFAGLPDTLAALADAAAYASLENRTDWQEITGQPLDLIHLFETSHASLAKALPALRARLAPAGAIWVSWPKKAAKRPTDLTEDAIRALALADVLVDVKVCAVDETWSGLKLVIRKEHRAAQEEG
jgi:hypothetical protein